MTEYTSVFPRLFDISFIWPRSLSSWSVTRTAPSSSIPNTPGTTQRRLSGSRGRRGSCWSKGRRCWTPWGSGSGSAVAPVLVCHCTCLYLSKYVTLFQLYILKACCFEYQHIDLRLQHKKFEIFFFNVYPALHFINLLDNVLCNMFNLSPSFYEYR